jgi:hypothetical protein
LIKFLCAKWVRNANQRTMYVSRLSELFLNTNIVYLSARKSAKKRKLELEKSWLNTTKTSSGLGTPDSVRCPRLTDGEPAALGKRRSDATINHLTVRWYTGLSGESSPLVPAPDSSTTNSSLSGKEKGDVAIIHRTVRWCTGLSGESTAPESNGRSRNQRATRGLRQQSVGHTGLSGAPTGSEAQR